MASITSHLVNCYACEKEISMKNDFKVHKCLTFYCGNCPVGDTCGACDLKIMDADFIHHENLKSCKYTNCEQDASLHCTCTQMELCEIHLLKVHSKVPEQKKCTPVQLYQEREETFCSCNEFYASFFNKCTKEELCFSCYMKLDDKKNFMEKESASLEYFEIRLELLRNSVSTYHRLNKSREEQFKAENNDYNIKITDALGKITELVNKSKSDNSSKLEKMKHANREAQILSEKLGDAACFSMLIKMGQSNANKMKFIDDKLASWVKEKLKKLNQPSLSKIFIDTNDQGTRFMVHETVESTAKDQDNEEPGPSGLSISKTQKRQLENSPLGSGASKRLVIDMEIIDTNTDEGGVSNREQGDQGRLERYETDSIHTDDIFESDDEYDPCSPVMVYENVEIGPFRKLDLLEQKPVHVRLTGIRCPLWLFFEIPELQEKRMQMINMLNEPLNLMQAYDIKPDDFVIIQDTDQYGAKKKRAKIIRPGTIKSTWTVKLLDYGREIAVPANKIFLYPENLDYTDETCFHAALIGIWPRSKFIFVMIQPRNTVSYIKDQLLHPSNIVTVHRKFVSKDNRVWCYVKSQRNGQIYDWSKELVKANLALPYLDAFIPAKDYCYLGHFYGKCRANCQRVHDCPFCDGNHLLTSCYAFIQETKSKEGQAT